MAILLALPVICSATLHPAPDTDTASYYQRGLDAKEEGKYHKALSIWEEARDRLSEPDLRIARSYIALVTEQGIKPKYKKASEIYLWGINGNDVDTYRKQLKKEVTLLRPLTGYKNYRDMEKKVEDGDPTVYEDIRMLWASLDPTPFTKYNERLIEHWERVAYSRENFSRINNKGLDDRARIFIKFGEPEVKRNGILMYNSGTVNMLLQERIGVEMPNIRGNPMSNATRQVRQFNLETSVRQYHNNPEYEVWIYHRLTGKPENTIYLFGTDSGSPTFRLKKSVEDFIPNAAFSMSDRNRSLNISGRGALGNMQQSDDQGQSDIQAFEQSSFGSSQAPDQVSPTFITPGLILQLMYYKQFSALDAFFGDTYGRMLRRYMDQNSRVPVSLGREFENRNAGRIIELRSRAPEEISVYKRKLGEIPVEAYTYRFLDEDNRPYVRMYLKASPGDALLYDQIRSNNRIDGSLASNYRVENGVQLLGPKRSILEEQVRSDTLTPASSREVISSFRLPQEGQVSGVLAASHLYNHRQESDTSLSDETPFNRYLKAIGKREIELPESLSRDELAMADLILGYRSGDSAHSGSFLPFTISHDRAIPEGEDLHLYYELYHLAQHDATGKSSFTFKYEINPERKGLRKLFGKKEAELSITLNNEAFSSRYEKELVIDTSALAPGRYSIDIEITDKRTERKLERSIPFTIE